MDDRSVRRRPTGHQCLIGHEAYTLAVVYPESPTAVRDGVSSGAGRDSRGCGSRTEPMGRDDRRIPSRPTERPVVVRDPGRSQTEEGEGEDEKWSTNDCQKSGQLGLGGHKVESS